MFTRTMKPGDRLEVGSITISVRREHTQQRAGNRLVVCVETPPDGPKITRFKEAETQGSHTISSPLHKQHL
jgi:hypothetical protein